MQRILVVDDTKTIRHLVVKHLEHFDAELTTAATANEALAQFEAAPADLIISDIEMPGMSGVELCELLRQRHGSKVKVLLMSAGAAPSGRAAVERGIADEFLPKPLVPSVLQDAAARLLATMPGPSTSRRNRDRIRVLVADDTAVGRKVLERVLKQDDQFEVVGTASGGREVVDLAISLKPRLILLDEILPELDGIEATREIMRKAPTRVVVMAQEGGGRVVFDATAAGAVDFMVAPAWSDLDGDVANGFRDRLKELAEVPVVRHWRVTTNPSRRTRSRVSPGRASLVAICSSTGGPGVLAHFLQKLAPAIDHVPVAVVQHVLSGFAGSLAQWLTDVSQVEVIVPKPNDPVEPGRVVLAPDGHHLKVAQGDVWSVEASDPVGAHRPSGTPLFESAAEHHGAGVVAVLLTGMGEDGVAGLDAVKSKGGTVFVQSPETCVVPGMVNAAIERELADIILPPDEIAVRIADMVERGRKGGR